MARRKRRTRIRVSGVGKISAARKNKKVVFGLFLGVMVLVLVLVGLIFSSFGFLEKPGEPELFIVKDECGDVMGNLIHQIRDAGECRIKCVNECDVREIEFVRFEFEAKDVGCHSCDCWCA